MPNFRIALVTGTEITRQTLASQLESIIGDRVEIDSYAIDNWNRETIESNLVVLSSSVVLDEQGFSSIPPNAKIIVAKRIINYNEIDKLLAIPDGTDVLLVNDVPSAVKESINSLEKLGVDHLNYIPYCPSESDALVRPISIAITPGEIEYVPTWVEQVINIGPRLIDFTTIVEILRFFDLLDDVGDNLSEKYMKKIVQLSKALIKTNQETEALNSHLKKVLDGVNDGILALDFHGTITAFNENLESFLSISRQNAIGKKLEEIIKDPELIYFISNGDTEDNKLYSLDHREVVVNRFRIDADQSIVCTFKDAKETIEIEKKLKQKLMSKGYIAKYKLNDIIGESPEIKNAREIAQKIAKTQLTVLIEGESGTGKELFASAIHTLSERRNGPFLAVNFSALPEELVESELFGYEEGAFTGAKRGGKPGLFEQADGGTIFLDEIGDISLKIQARLLRVLQEKEVMRVGGSKIIPVNVRIIAATNQPLVTMIQKNEFRVDLYHRLKALYLHLPPLRDRTDDLLVLIKHFMLVNSKAHIQIDDEVIEHLKSMSWYGNIRELKNTIDYMLTVCDGTRIRMSDIPDHHFFEGAYLQHHQMVQQSGQEQQEIESPAVVVQPGKNTIKDQLLDWEAKGEKKEYLFILRKIYEMNQQRQLVGRKLLSQFVQNHLQYPLSEQQMRHRLEYLEQLGFIQKRKGRAGTKITAYGKQILVLDGEINDNIT